MRKSIGMLPLLASVSLLSACSDDSTTDSANSEVANLPVAVAAAVDSTPSPTPDFNTDRNAYFGDLHVHTMYSFDAFIFGTTSSPDDAYEFAKGKPIKHPAGFDVSLGSRPLCLLRRD